MKASRYGLDIGLVVTLCFLLAFSLGHAEETGGGQTQEQVSEATDAELVDMLSSERRDEARAVLFHRSVLYGAEEGAHENLARLADMLSAVVIDGSVEEARMEALSLLRAPLMFGPGSDEAFPAVCHALVEDPSLRVRFTAAGMLGDLGRADAIPFLEQIIVEAGPRQSELERDVTERAIGALGNCGPEAVPVLLELKSDEKLSKTVPTAILVSALAATGDELFALPELLKIVDTGNPPEVSYAVAGLGAGFHKYPSEAQSTIMDVIRTALSHPSHHVREAACNAIMYIGNPAHIPLVEPLLEDPHKELSRQLDETNTNFIEVELYPVRKRAEMAIKELQRIAEQREKVAASSASPYVRHHIPSLDRP